MEVEGGDILSSNISINELNSEEILNLFMLLDNWCYGDYPIYTDKNYISLEQKELISGLRTGFPAFTKLGEQLTREYYENIVNVIEANHNRKKDIYENCYIITKNTGIDGRVVEYILREVIK